jgi:3-hydroxybutyryl-CoA dehydratase
MVSVYVGDTVQTIVEVTEKIEKARDVVLRTYCVNQEGTRVVDGEAKVLLPEDSGGAVRYRKRRSCT